MLVDSHCHLDRVKLGPYCGEFSAFIRATRESGVGHMLCVSIDLESYPGMLSLVEGYPEVSVSVGVHPNDSSRRNPTAHELVDLARHPKNVAIGETGLDYHYCQGDLTWQRERFLTHIEAARLCSKPLIVHTREAREDTIALMREGSAEEAGGVMHCFTEDWATASKALDMGFFISFSGIVTFKNADDLRDVVRRTPIDRMLIETDSPYLAPVPFRGKPNEPRHVRYVAECIAEVRGLGVEELTEITARNFFALFPAAAAIASRQ